MKRSFKSVLGVTLLEIMLVLAIAAMIIVMSIRYYQSASTNQKIASALDTLTGIVAAGESYLGAVGTLASFSTGTMKTYLGANTSPNSPWGGAITVTPGNANSYTISFPTSPAAGSSACSQFTALITSQNNKIVPSACGGSSGMTFSITE